MAPARRIGPYELVRPLGRGGMGAVFEVRQPGLERALALKVLARGPLHERAVERFRREGQALARVRHPGVVTVHQAEDSPQGPYLVTDLVPGEDLERWLEGHGPPPARRAAEIARDLASAVAAVHAAGLLHRDLKPANVILTPEGQPVLVDFGLARIEDAERLTRTGAVLGTPAFMAPEQIAGAPADARTDVFGLGVVLLHLLGGTVEGSGSATRLAAPPVLDPGLRAVCDQAMAASPAARYASADELREELERWLRGEPPLAEGRQRRRVARRALLALGAGGGLALLVGWAALGRPPAAAPAASAAPSPSSGRPARAPSDEQRAGSEALEAALVRRDPAQRRDALRVWLAEHPAHPHRARADAALRLACWEAPGWTLEPEGARGARAAVSASWIDARTALLVARGPELQPWLERWELDPDPCPAPRRLEGWEAPRGARVGFAALEGRPVLLLAGEASGEASRPWLEVRDPAAGLPGKLLARRDLPGPPRGLVGARGAPRLLLWYDARAGAETLWCDLRDPGLRGEVVLPGQAAHEAAWSPDGGRVALTVRVPYASTAESLVVWEVESGRELHRAPQERNAGCLAFDSAGSDRVAVGSHGGDVLLHTVGRDEPVALCTTTPGPEGALGFVRAAHYAPVVGVGFVRGGLVSVGALGERGELRRWDLQRASELPPAVSEAAPAFSSLDASPEGERLLLGATGRVELRWVPAE